MSRKPKKIRTIGGIKVGDIIAPTIPTYIDKNGNLRERSNLKGRGKDSDAILATKKQIQQTKKKYETSALKLGGESYKKLSEQQKTFLKKSGYTTKIIRKLELTNTANAIVKRGEKAKILTFTDLTTKVDRNGNRILRNEKRSNKSSLATGQKALQKRLEFISGKYYASQDAQYRANWLEALKGGFVRNYSGGYDEETTKKLIYYLENGGDVNQLPDLRAEYKGLLLNKELTLSKINTLINQLNIDEEGFKNYQEILMS